MITVSEYSSFDDTVRKARQGAHAGRLGHGDGREDCVHQVPSALVPGVLTWAGRHAEVSCAEGLLAEHASSLHVSWTASIQRVVDV